MTSLNKVSSTLSGGPLGSGSAGSKAQQDEEDDNLDNIFV